MGKAVKEIKRIFEAIENGDTEMVKQLIGNGIDVNTRDEDNISLLHMAVCGCHDEIVKFLIENGADVNAADDGTWCPLHYAVECNQTEIVKMLLKHGADAAKAELIAGMTPFCFAVMNIEDDGGTMAKFMLKNGVDINAESEKGFAVIHFLAGFFDDASYVKFMLDNDADVNAHASINGATALHLAVRNSHFKIAKLLLDNGADVNAADDEGLTPLHYCARYTEDNTKMAQLLLDNGADVNAEDKSGMTPFVDAFVVGNFSLAPMLNNRENSIQS